MPGVGQAVGVVQAGSAFGITTALGAAYTTYFRYLSAKYGPGNVPESAIECGLAEFVTPDRVARILIQVNSGPALCTSPLRYLLCALCGRVCNSCLKAGHPRGS